VATSSFAALLREHRLARGLTQEELAERAGLSGRAISDLERGLKQAPRPSTVRLLVRGLGLPEAEAVALLHAAQPRREAVLDTGLGHDRHTLPLPLSSFVGRERELAEVGQLLRSARLLTLTGPGGIGKTRLAIEAARRLDAAAGALYWVELAGFTDPADVGPTIAQVLGVREQMGQPLPRTLAGAFGARRALLILDNCEHLLDATAALVQGLLTACPSLRILATSREPLQVAGEQVWRVAPMAIDLPDAPTSAHVLAASDAVRLFVERARAARHDFPLDPLSIDTIVGLCRRLDGVPLAIELAAARARYLSLHDIVAHLDHQPDFLQGQERAAPARHQSLAATIAWSYQLLDAPQQRLFERLSVFAGGATLELIEVVCVLEDDPDPAVVDRLGRLVDQSLVLAEPVPDGGLRYRLLEPLRQFAAARLRARGGAEAVHLRHALAFLNLTDGGDQSVWAFGGLRLEQRSLIERERDNLRAALDWFTATRRLSEALRLSNVLAWFWLVHGLEREMLDRLNGLLHVPGAERTRERAMALRTAGRLAWQLGDDRTREQRAQQALAAFGELDDPVGVVLALQDLASVETHRGRFDQAEARWQEALAIIDRGDVPPGLRARVLLGRARVARDRGEHRRAHALFDAARAAVPFLGAHDVGEMFRAQVLVHEGVLALYEGDVETARRLLEQAHGIQHGLGDRGDDTIMLTLLGWVALAGGDAAGASAYFRECLAHDPDAGRRLGQVLLLEGLAGLRARTMPEPALRAVRIADGLRSAMGRTRPAAEQRLIDGWLAPARQRPAASRAGPGQHTGPAVSPDALIAELMGGVSPSARSSP